MTLASHNARMRRYCEVLQGVEASVFGSSDFDLSAFTCKQIVCSQKKPQERHAFLGYTDVYIHSE